METAHETPQTQTGVDNVSCYKASDTPQAPYQPKTRTGVEQLPLCHVNRWSIYLDYECLEQSHTKVCTYMEVVSDPEIVIFLSTAL